MLGHIGLVLALDEDLRHCTAKYRPNNNFIVYNFIQTHLVQSCILTTKRSTTCKVVRDHSAALPLNV